VDNGSDLATSATSADHVTQHPEYSSGQIGLLAACLKRAIDGVRASRFWTVHEIRGISATICSGFT
jgi:hypothetical protein